MALLCLGIFVVTDEDLSTYVDFLEADSGTSLLDTAVIIVIVVSVVILLVGLIGTAAALLANEILLIVVSYPISPRSCNIVVNLK